MRRHIVAIVLALILIPLAWLGYQLLGPHPVLAVEDKLGITRRDAKELRSNLLDGMALLSGVVGVAGFFKERRRSRRKSRAK